MKKFKIIVLGDLPIASKIAEWVQNNPELELVGAVLSNPNAHNHDPWPDVPMLSEYCEKQRIPLFTLDDLKSIFKRGEIDLGLICRFSKIIRKDVISLFRLGMINMHGGLLPEFAGLYSCNFSILFGNGKGGGTLHWIDESIDSGDIIRRCEFDILPEDTAYTVFQKTQTALYENMIDIVLPVLHCEFTSYIKQQDLLEQGYEHRYFKSGSINDYKEIHLNMEEDEILKTIRACDFPGYEPAWILDKNGNKIYLRYHY